ncbi:MAG: hypothetical protein AAFR61_17025 [Bacteroidota bacterium]
MGYLAWGGDNQAFLFQMEADILVKLFTEPGSIVHPLIIFPLLGQILLIITLFQKEPNKLIIYIGIACIGLLFGVIGLVGLLNLNFGTILSILPFFALAILTLMAYRKRRLQTT